MEIVRQTIDISIVLKIHGRLFLLLKTGFLCVSAGLEALIVIANMTLRLD